MQIGEAGMLAPSGNGIACLTIRITGLPLPARHGGSAVHTVLAAPTGHFQNFRLPRQHRTQYFQNRLTITRCGRVSHSAVHVSTSWQKPPCLSIASEIRRTVFKAFPVSIELRSLVQSTKLQAPANMGTNINIGSSEAFASNITLTRYRFSQRIDHHGI